MLSVDYMAGFYDGEGCFYLRSPVGTSSCHHPIVVVCNTNFEIMRAIAYTLSLWQIDCKFRNSRPAVGNRKPVYDVSVNKRKHVYDFCCIMHDHLKVKQEQAGILMKYIELRESEGIRGKIHQCAELELFNKIKILNKRGTER